MRMAMSLHNALLLTTFLVLTFSTPLILSSSSQPSPSKLLKTYKKFIKTSCNMTSYSSLCYKNLSPYASIIKTDPLKLSYAALNVSIKEARDTSAMVKKLAKQKGITSTEVAAISDCIENTEDSVYELQDSLTAVSKLKGDDKEYQLANAITWVSAAITDEDTCMDGFSGRKISSEVKKKIKNAVVAVMRLASVALSLINSLH